MSQSLSWTRQSKLWNDLGSTIHKKGILNLISSCNKENVLHQNITTMQEAHLAPDYTRDKVISPSWEGVIDDDVKTA